MDLDGMKRTRIYQNKMQWEFKGLPSTFISLNTGTVKK